MTIWQRAGQMGIMVVVAVALMGTTCEQETGNMAVQFPSVDDLAGNPTQLEFKEAISAFLAATQALPGALIDATALTIDSGGYILPVKGFHRVDTYGGAAADDLEYIHETALPDGWLLFLQQANDARTVTLKHGNPNSGGMDLPGGQDIALQDSFDGVLLRRTGSRWRFLARLADYGSIGALSPHGFAYWDTPGGYNWIVPDNVTVVYCSAIGGGGGGGGGGDSSVGNGLAGQNGTLSRIYFTSQTITLSAGLGMGGPGGRQDGQNPGAKSAAQLPILQQGGRNPNTMTLGANGQGGAGGTGSGTATGGAAGDNGGGFLLRQQTTFAGESIGITVGSGGAGGAGRGSGTSGSNGGDGAVLIAY